MVQFCDNKNLGMVQNGKNCRKVYHYPKGRCDVMPTAAFFT